MASGMLTDLKNKMKNMTLQVDKLKADHENKLKLLSVESANKQKAEGEVAALQKRIRQLEDELESTETRLTEATGKLEEASKAADESDRYRRSMKTWRNLEGDRIDRLTKSVKATSDAIHDATEKYEEAARKLTITEVELERAESRLEAAESRLRELRDVLHEASTLKRSLEHHEAQTVMQREKYERQINELSQKLAQTEERTLKSRQLEASLQSELCKLDETLEAGHLNHENLQKEMENIMNEFNTM